MRSPSQIFHSRCFTRSVFPNNRADIVANELKFFSKSNDGITPNCIDRWINHNRTITSKSLEQMELIQPGITKGFYIPFYFLLYEKNHSIAELQDIAGEILRKPLKFYLKNKSRIELKPYEVNPHHFLHSQDLYDLTKLLIELRLSEKEGYPIKHYEIFEQIMARIPAIAVMPIFKDSYERLVESLDILREKNDYSKIIIEINFDWLEQAIKESKHSSQPNRNYFKESPLSFTAMPCVLYGKIINERPFKFKFLSF